MSHTIPIYMDFEENKGVKQKKRRKMFGNDKK